MSAQFRLFGSEMSPYSVKVRAALRFKRLPHAWVARNAATEAEFQRHARLPLVPTILFPDGTPMQDSTPILHTIEAAHPEPRLDPEDAVHSFLSDLLEEFGDEWVNKLMFHHRWHAPLDRAAAAHILAHLYLPESDPTALGPVADQIADRMSGRLHVVGSSPENATALSAWLATLVGLLEPHLVRWRYLLGARPCMGDLGVAAQIYEAAIDPTAGALIRARGPSVLNWCHRVIDDPRVEGDLEPWDALEPTLLPLLSHVGSHFLRWSRANAEAVAAARTDMTVELGGIHLRQAPQKYAARSLGALQQRLAAVAGDDTL
ncbi:MAG: glutathione S-transferase family protein, partial [Thermaurantiacus sp.]